MQSSNAFACERSKKSSQEGAENDKTTIHPAPSAAAATPIAAIIPIFFTFAASATTYTSPSTVVVYEVECMFMGKGRSMPFC